MSRPDCLVRFLEVNSAESLTHAAVSRREAGDLVPAALYALLAKHHDEILEDLRAGGAVRELERRDLACVRKPAGFNAQPPAVAPRERWGVADHSKRLAADAATLPEALRKLDATELETTVIDPRLN